MTPSDTVKLLDDDEESQRRWDDLFSRSQDLLAELAAEARREYRAGLTEPLDPEKL